MNKIIVGCLTVLTLTLSAGASLLLPAAPFYQAELIFPLESWHNHASMIVECPNGDLLVTFHCGVETHGPAPHFSASTHDPLAQVWLGSHRTSMQDASIEMSTVIGVCAM